MNSRVAFLWMALFSLVAASPASAAVIVFNNNLAGFNAAAGSPPVTLDFDSIAAGTDLAASTVAGISFSNPDGNTLEVVAGLSTTSQVGFIPPGDADNRLFPTSGANVLSPGGVNLVTGPQLGQRDSLRLDFSSPMSSFGLDILFQSLDGASFLGFTVYDSLNNVLVSNGFIAVPALPNGADLTSPAAQGGSIFLGFVSDSADIARIDFIEFDDNEGNPDANVGYDSFRFAVPEPSSLMLLALGLGILGVKRAKA
jgi:hypothetical protein